MFAVLYVLFARTLVTFYVVNVVDNKRHIRQGVEVVSTLAKKVHSSTDAFDFRVVELNTVGKFSLLLLFVIFSCIAYKRKRPLDTPQGFFCFFFCCFLENVVC